MNAERAFRMLIRMFMRKGINAGIQKGADAMHRNGTEPATPEQQKASKHTARQAKKAMRMARRINRMR